MLRRLAIKPKLLLLAGVPLLAVLVLAALMAREAQQASRAADSLRSVNDLSELSTAISELVVALQDERARSAMVLSSPPDERPPVIKEQQATDHALAELEALLSRQNVEHFPALLRTHLGEGTKLLRRVDGVRKDVKEGDPELEGVLDFYSEANQSLIRATSGLSQLTDDGKLLRSLNGLESVMQVGERTSYQHAMLAYVFSKGEFPPGTFRKLVTLTTEEELFEQRLRTSAPDQEGLYDTRMRQPSAVRAEKMLQTALTTIEDDFGVEAEDWFKDQGERVRAITSLEQEIAKKIRLATAAKSASVRQTVQISAGVSAVAIVLSLLLALLLIRGLVRSVDALGTAARKVHEGSDYSVRAEKTSEDELGLLTDAFNDMLDGLQRRDRELKEANEQLEERVEQRTAELAQRNEEMRLVLDNVGQGLATIDAEGNLSGERSRSFDEMFGAPSTGSPFSSLWGQNNQEERDWFDLGWEQFIEGLMPEELTLGQLPRRLSFSGREIELSYEPIEQDGTPTGALVVATDITERLTHARQAAEQQELLEALQRVMRDRIGFVDFVEETKRLLDGLKPSADPTAAFASIHTIKGNCAVNGASTVASACHETERRMQDAGRFEAVHRKEVREAWEAWWSRVRTMVETDAVASLTASELSELEDAIVAERPPRAILRLLRRYQNEPVAHSLERLAERTRSVSKTLKKPHVKVDVAADDLRLPRDRWRSFWAAMVHVVRNAVDHGVEEPDERRQAGKAEGAHVRLSARQEGGMCFVEVSDDGRGIDWESVAQRAAEQGIPAETSSELSAALFHSGLTTRSSASETSGRGVGMNAVAECVRAMGGEIDVTSRRGEGATVTIRVPLGEEEAVSSRLARDARPNAGAAVPPGPVPVAQNDSWRVPAS